MANLKSGAKEYTSGDRIKLLLKISLGVIVILCIVAVVTVKKTNNTKSKVIEDEVIEEDKGKIGTPVDTPTEVAVITTLNTYFNVFNQDVTWATLDSCCVDSSYVSYVEKQYRERSKGSYDNDDCMSRGIRAFSEYVELVDITSVREEGDYVYAYCNVISVDIEQLPTYYEGCTADLTFYLNSTGLSYEGLSKFIFQNISLSAVPVKSQEMCIQLKKVDNSYLIVSDTDILLLTQDAYIQSLSILINNLGKTSATNYFQ